MKIVFLGTGTSVGVPMIGCDCAVCRSADTRNRRRRSSLYVMAGGRHLVVDTPPDFREQALACRLPRVDAVLFTHSHADHIFGFDDIRRFNTMQDEIIPAYADPGTLADLRRVFNYIGTDPVPGVYRPRIAFRPVTGAFAVGPVQIEPLPVAHGPGTALGYLLACEGCTLGYVPDCSELSAAVVARCRGCDVMILDGLRHRPHATHLTVTQSVAWLQAIGAKRSFLVHMGHDLDHAATEAALPPGIKLSYDGLEVAW